MAGPAAQAPREHQLDPDTVDWLQTNSLKTELELGHCLRLPQEGPCECDLVLSCSKFVTTSDYTPPATRPPRRRRSAYRRRDCPRLGTRDRTSSNHPQPARAPAPRARRDNTDRRR